MENATLKRMLAAYHQGTLGEQDKVLLHAYIYSATEEQQEQLALLLTELKEELAEDGSIPVPSETIYEAILSDPRYQSKKKPVIYRWSTAVAAVMCAVFFGVWLWASKGTGDNQITNRQRVRETTTSPTEKLSLTAADGTVYDIDDLENQQNKQANSSSFFVMEDGALVYRNKNTVNQSDATDGIHAVHTVSTPKGRQLKLVLPDGTKVWLNAATVLKFPVQFDGQRRRVELDGEAYFEVEKAAHWPFVVKSAGQEVNVLGTHFNVLAYKEDAISRTTLLEGKVNVSSPAGHHTLKPGQQLFYQEADNRSVVRSVTAEDVVAWKEQLFIFQDEKIKDVMRAVSRWYDLAVEYTDGMEGKHITGSLPRYKDIYQLMEALQATGLLQYQIEGGTIIISK